MLALLAVIITRPASFACLFALLSGFFGFLNYKVDFEQVTFSYAAVYERQQLSRIITAPFFHASLVHLLMNMSAVWTCSFFEEERGTLEYMRATALLIGLSAFVHLALTHCLVLHANWRGLVERRDSYRTCLSVGYSGVAFGLATLLGLAHPMYPVPFLFANFPAWSAPLFNLILTQFLVRRASLLAHVSGIIAGVFLHFGGLDVVSNFAVFCLAAQFVGGYMLEHDMWPFENLADGPAAVLDLPLQVNLIPSSVIAERLDRRHQLESVMVGAPAPHRPGLYDMSAAQSQSGFASQVSRGSSSNVRNTSFPLPAASLSSGQSTSLPVTPYRGGASTSSAPSAVSTAARPARDDELDPELSYPIDAPFRSFSPTHPHPSRR
ncbi:hypothetical protein CAOG_009657 [Capsaspora owczarzaki ATCC 30864]|uniref:Peptidase S54 rhomboid domain-containing protein n=2 Tax=Capsaspora owczarzaki (strain ATCC 30864) TaxID=595528 RepID=A0A0D2WMZ8_CAPO3|nr:hypothetical protein CAOG_009657 [Capsaspora owczarzaki ATCC 30864]